MTARQRFRSSANGAAPGDGAHRRGAALLLTMGVLLLVTVLFMAFSLVAIMNQQSAVQAEGDTKARLGCEAKLSDVYAQFARDWCDNPGDARNLFPANKAVSTATPAGTFSQSHPLGHRVAAATGAWAGRVYWVSTTDTAVPDQAGIDAALHVALGGANYTPVANVTGQLRADAGWEHLMGQPSTPGGSDTPIVARVAWLVIDESGKCDPTTATDSAVLEGAEDARVGRYDSELSLAAVFHNNGTDNTAVGRSFRSSLPAGRRWLSYFNLAKGNPACNAATDTRVCYDTVFPYGYDYEAFFDDSPKLDRHRFQLDTAGWDACNNSVARLDTDAPLFFAAGGDSTVLTTIRPNTGGGIPWLHYASDTVVGKQVMANLVDYCDSDNFATTDWTGGATNVPTYVGLEKVPYLNEIVITAGPLLKVDNTHYTLQLWANPEVVWLYDGVSPACQLDFNVMAYKQDGSTITIPVTFSIPAGAVATPGYRNLGNVKQANQVNFSRAATSTGFKVVLRNARITSGGRLLDYAFDLDLPSATMALNTTEARSASIEVNDPRDNLRSGQWTWRASGWITTVNGSIDSGPPVPASNTNCLNPLVARNQPFNPGVSGADGDSVTQPWLVSTAYIRNAPMRSLGELGAIHRGEPWKTLNLTKYSGKSGWGDYADGDADILDQVKLGSQVVSTGKVNVNTRSVRVIAGLLSRVRVGQTPAQLGTASGGTLVTTANALAIAHSAATSDSTTWLCMNGTDSAACAPFRDRGQLATIANLTDGTIVAQPTSLAKEELLGKIANLCSTRPTYVTIIVTAQAIKDLPTGVNGGTRGRYDAGVDKIIAERKVLAVLRRDAYWNKFNLLRFDYLDD